jgi:serine/threonine protein kinase
MGNAAT